MERGRSLSELGRSMTWSDLRAFITHLPPTAHYWRMEEPDRAMQSAWAEALSTPQTILLGQLFDLLETDILLRAGQQPSETGIITRLANRTRGRKPVAKPAVGEKRRRSAADIRAQLKRAQDKR